MVTGGAGFLGAHVAAHLAADGVGVRIFDRAPRPPWADELGVRYVQGDIRDLDAVTRLAAGVGAVVHAAFAPPQADPSTIQSVNVEGTEAACRAARATGARMVLISSTIVSRRLRPHPLSRRAPVSRFASYRAARVAAEDLAQRHADTGLALAVVRPKTFVGAGRLGGFALVFDTIRRGGHVPIMGDGRNRYQVIDVGDLAGGLARLARTPQDATGLFFFGAGDVGTVAEDLASLMNHAATGARLRFLPAVPARAALSAIELAGLAPLAEWHHCGAWGRDSVVDISRAGTELGWKPRRTNAEALIGAYDWYVGEQRSRPVPTTHPVPTSHRVLQRLAGARANR